MTLADRYESSADVRDLTPPRGVIRSLTDIARAQTLLRRAPDTNAYDVVAETESNRTRHYFVNPATDLQVMVNVWPGGYVDIAFEHAPGVFGPPIAVRRIEREAVTA